jgi:hypothetical protein
MPEGFIVTSNERPQLNECYYSRLSETIGYTAPNGVHNINLDKVIAQQDQIDFSSLSEEQQKEIGLNQYDFAQMFYEILKKTYPYFDEWIEAKEYKKAQSLLSDRRFSLDEVRQSFWKCCEIRELGYSVTMGDLEVELSKSLSQKSWKVELEMTYNVFTSAGASDLELSVHGLQDVIFSSPKLTNGKIKILKLCQNNLV